MKDTAVMMGVVVVVAIIVTVGFYEVYRLPQETESLRQQVTQLQAQLSQRVSYIEPSDIRLAADPTVLNYTADVNASDDVATQVWHNTTIDIDVKDIPNRDMTTVRLTLAPPGEDEGLPDDLEQNEFQVYITTTTGSTVYLFGKDWNGEYQNGWTFDISENEAMTVTLCTSMKACNDIFEDGQTHTIYLYLYEPNVGVNGQGKVIDYLTLTLNT